MTEVGGGTWRFQRRGETPQLRKDRDEFTPLKKRYLPFYAMVAEGLATMDLDEAAMAAGRRMGWMSNQRGLPKSDTALRKKVNAILARPDTPAGIRMAIETVTGFGAPEMIRKVVDWIEGRVEAEQIVRDKDGNEVGREMVKLPPSERMLAKLMDVTLPKAPKQVNVDQRMLIGRIQPQQNSAPPPLRARVLSSTPAITSSND